MGRPSTRERLLISAERLMARNGIAETSVRTITQKADANIAAVNYHFGGKNELIREVLRTRFERFDALLAEGLDRVEADSREQGARPLLLADVVRVYLDTLIGLGIDRRTGTLDPFILLIERAATEHAAELEAAQDLGAPGITRLVAMIAESSGRPVVMDRQFKLLVDLMYSGAVTVMRIIVKCPPEDVQAQETAAAVRQYVTMGVEGYLQALFAGNPATPQQ